MAGSESLLRPPPVNFSSFRSLPPPISISYMTTRSYRRRRAARVVSGLGLEGYDPVLEAALVATSLRSQESLRPDPLFVDPYACALLSSTISPQDMDAKFSTAINALSPQHYRLATKFIDDGLIALLTNSDELRQIVLLTDGMDTRPYRLNWPRQSVIYCVSPIRILQSSSQTLKSLFLFSKSFFLNVVVCVQSPFLLRKLNSLEFPALATGLGAKVSKNCFLVHVPLESTDLQASLCEKGFNGSRQSLWVLQGLPIPNLRSLNKIFSAVSNLAMKGSTFMGELSTIHLKYMESHSGTLDVRCKLVEKLFTRHGFHVSILGYDEIARNMHLDEPSENKESFLFTAEQLRLSDAQLEIWRTHFNRIEEEGDEEGFEEL